MNMATLNPGSTWNIESKIATRFDQALVSTSPIADADFDLINASAKSLVPMVTATRLIAAPRPTWDARLACWPDAIRLEVVAPDWDQL